MTGGFLDSYTKTIDPGLLSCPDLEDILSSIRSANNSTPGPDGIPFARWRAVPDLSARRPCSRTPPSGFNHGFLFLLPKKDTALVLTPALSVLPIRTIASWPRPSPSH